MGETGRPMQERIKEHDRDIRLARTRTPSFLNTPAKPATILSGTKSSLLIGILIGTHVGSRKLSIKE